MQRMKIKFIWLLLAWLPHASPAAEQWLPVKDVSLIVEPGSILDFSKLLPQSKAIKSRVVVNPDGQFALQDKPAQPQRFLMASLGFGVATGSFPDHAMADLFARQLRMHGYNMARLDFVEETLMFRRRFDFEFDPGQLDRFHYLLSALRREGIYYILNGLSSGNAGFGDIKERWVDQRHVKLRLYYDQEAQAHWKKLMDRMLASVNPYTRISTLADPALAGLIMVNEGGLAFVTRKGVPDELRPLFADWLRKKYLNTTALAKAWNGELGKRESLEAKSVGFPKTDAWTSRRMSDTQQFFVGLEKTTADWMTQYLRQSGYQGLLTSYDNWISPAAHLSRGQFDWVDLHNYFSEPSGFSAPGSVMRQDSMLEGGAKYITELAAGKQIGKAFTVSEYGQVFWNKYRRESALAVPAYASFQGWSMISQHAWAIDLSYASSGGRKDAIYPFVIGLDPIARANETLAALLFLRGDVAPAKNMLGVKLNPSFVFDQNAFLSSIPRDISQLALVTGVGLDWQGRLETAGKYDAQIEPGNSNLTAFGNGSNAFILGGQSMAGKVDTLAREYVGRMAPKISKTSLVVDDRFNARVATLRKAGLLDPSNRTNTSKGLYQTDTGQVLMDSQRRRLTVVTPKSEAVVFDTPEPITLDNLVVEQSSGPAMVSVSSMDGQPLHASKRMLVILATDARNSGMRFADTAETTLQDLGKKPVLIRAVMVNLKLKNQNAAILKVFSNNLRGQRGDAIPITRELDGISFVLDTARLSHGPTTYFEITSQE
jgi:hypothetical protein